MPSHIHTSCRGSGGDVYRYVVCTYMCGFRLAPAPPASLPSAARRMFDRAADARHCLPPYAPKVRVHTAVQIRPKKKHRFARAAKLKIAGTSPASYTSTTSLGVGSATAPPIVELDLDAGRFPAFPCFAFFPCVSTASAAASALALPWPWRACVRHGLDTRPPRLFRFERNGLGSSQTTATTATTRRTAAKT